MKETPMSGKTESWLTPGQTAAINEPQFGTEAV